MGVGCWGGGVWGGGDKCSPAGVTGGGVLKWRYGPSGDEPLAGSVKMTPKSPVLSSARRGAVGSSPPE